MNTKKWKLRVGHGVNEVSDQGSTLRFQFIVFTPKRNNSGLRLHTGQSGKPIAMQTTTIDNLMGTDVSLGRLHHCLTSSSLYGIYLRTYAQLAALGRDSVPQFLANSHNIDHSR